VAARFCCHLPPLPPLSPRGVANKKKERAAIKHLLTVTSHALACLHAPFSTIIQKGSVKLRVE
jgi:hypothetical protein